MEEIKATQDEIIEGKLYSAEKDSDTNIDFKGTFDEAIEKAKEFSEIIGST